MFYNLAASILTFPSRDSFGNAITLRDFLVLFQKESCLTFSEHRWDGTSNMRILSSSIQCSRMFYDFSKPGFSASPSERVSAVATLKGFSSLLLNCLERSQTISKPRFLGFPTARRFWKTATFEDSLVFYSIFHNIL